jgi:hypothetical protein
MHESRAATLAALPTHPVFLSDLDEGIVAVAVRFHVRDQNDAGYPFPSAENCYVLLLMLEAAHSTALGALVDFSPLTVLLREHSLGFERGHHGLHETLDCLAQLALNPAHVVTPDDPQGDLAIQRLLAALHLTLFGNLPLTLPKGESLGCKACAQVAYHGGASWIARVVGEAHAAGRLAPGYRLPTALELAAGAAEYDGPFAGIRAHGILQLSVRAAELLSALGASELALLADWHGPLLDRARELGLLRPPPSPTPPALQAA